MAGSYRRINYSLRPAKAIERKMLCDAFRRLYPFDKIEDYQYIGFGSIYFSDFHLFHRSFGMEDMLSIEKDAYAEECFEFNKPFNCVRLDCRPASEVLSDIDWSSRAIVWLDYDGMLDEMVLSDLTSVVARARSGTFVIVSVNANVERDPDDTIRKEYTADTGQPFDLDAYRLREARKRIGDAIPTEIGGRDLRGKGLATVSRRVINNLIDEVLSARNGTSPPEQKLKFEQVFNFLYSDGAQMLTVGGVIYAPEDEPKLHACAFNGLFFVRSSDEPYTIDVPCLTMKEMRHLNAQLPLIGGQPTPPPGVPPSDILKYKELYRYFPTFTEATFT
jgi:hypothetical protein